MQTTASSTTRSGFRTDIWKDSTSSTAVKKLHWEDGKPYCYTLDGHQKTGLLCLHFVGVTKIFMEGIYEHQDYAFGARFYTYLLTIRGHLADIKHGNTKFQQRIKIRRAEKASKASNN